MSGMSELALRLREDGVASDLSEIAARLGGEVHGRAVHAPSPNCPSDDRSLVVFIDPARPQSFFIYGCAGPLQEAKVLVRKKLTLVTSVSSPSFERSATALRIWAESVPAAGTPVERYLHSRAIKIAPPSTLRFHPALRHGPSGGTWPALVALVTTPHDAPAAIHRTYLAHDGRGKAPVEPNKMTLGPIRGNAIRLAPLADELMVGEGIETCMSVMQEVGCAAWSALSAVGLRALDLPSSVRKVTVLADGDDTGEMAALETAMRWQGEGRNVLIARAPRGLDFNDVLMGKAR
jgi:hypothetical protein